MRVGLLIYGSLDTLSGGYLYDRKLVQHLRDAGDDVEIISIPWRNYAAHLTDNFSDSLLRRLAGSRFDVLVQDELNHPSLFWLNQRVKSNPFPLWGKARKGAGVNTPIVSIVHHLRSSELRPAWQSKLYHLPEAAYLRSVDAFVFNSQTTRGVVENILGESRPNVVAFPAGDRLNPQVSDDEIVARARAGGALKVVFLGSVVFRKNLHTLLNALALLEKDFHLTIVGNLDVEPEYVSEIHQQVGRLSLGEKITFTGALNDEPLKKVLRESHILALPSSYEGFGIAYLEGMGYGLPAVGSTTGAAHEIITHGLDGYLANPSDAEALASHLSELANDREKLSKMSLAARERFLAHPSWDVSMEKIRAFLSVIASGARQSPS